jgi:hypothetical protein
MSANEIAGTLTQSKANTFKKGAEGFNFDRFKLIRALGKKKSLRPPFL